jgi:uncharacterized protein involved in exopolysaccharide biosynthesis
MSDFDEFKENFHRYSQYKASQRHGEELKRQSKLLEEQAKKAEMKADAEMARLEVEKQRLDLERREISLRKEKEEQVKDVRKHMTRLSSQLDDWLKG